MDTIDRILQLMKSSGVSPAQLTREAKITNGLMTQWKSGAQQPSTKSLAKIAAYFNVTTDFLLGNEQKEKAIPNRDSLINEAMEIMGNLPEDMKVAAVDVLKSLAALSNKKQKK